MKHLKTIFITALVSISFVSENHAQGKLFIIGGGKRTPKLMQSLVDEAHLKTNDYIVVLPMASEMPDTTFKYVHQDFKAVSKHTVVKFNIRKEQVTDTQIDSLKNAKLIFISGGDQNQFMKAVMNSPIYDAIHYAYAQKNAVIAGTSAGAAVMSEKMITGNQLRDEFKKETQFEHIWTDNIEFSEGLGLLKNAIIDQHFIKRSRYNRMFSALAAYPNLPIIGIDESTAIVVQGKKVKVVGESQVVMGKKLKNYKVKDQKLISFSDIQLSLLVAGDQFKLK